MSSEVFMKKLRGRIYRSEMREIAVLEKISFFYTFVGNTVTILRHVYEKLKMQFLTLQ